MDCKYPVHIFIPYDREHECWDVTEMINWLHENGIKRFRQPSFPRGGDGDDSLNYYYYNKNLRPSDYALKCMFRFADKNDALRFKIVWG